MVYDNYISYLKTVVFFHKLLWSHLSFGMFSTRTVLTLCLTTLSLILLSQEINHWETVVYNNDLWKYKIGSPEITENWIEIFYNDDNWSSGQGGFGYGDNDDNTILEDIFSIYLRKKFTVVDLDAISRIVLHADFDDGFVAYLNGIEIARQNLGSANIPVPYNETTPEYVEARLFQGIPPLAFPIGKEHLNNGENILSIQVHNHNTNSSDLSSNFFLSFGINNTSQNYGDTPNWFDNSVFETRLPILKISTPIDEEIMDEPKITAHLGVINNDINTWNSTLDDFNEYDGLIGIEIRGTSSQLFDKKGYGFETRNADGSNNNVELLGMPEENDWVLHGPYSDKSLLRNVISFHLGEKTGWYTPRARLCEVFINENYEGIYVLIEKIKQDNNRVDISKLTEVDNEGDELTGGYIIKADRNDMNIPGLGWNSNFPDYKFMAYVDPQSEEIIFNQRNYIMDYLYDFESAMAGTNYIQLYEEYINVHSLVDYFLVTEISKHIDAFKLSFYMYKDKDSKGGKLHFGPLWDFNLGYGNFDFSCSPAPEGWSYEFSDCGSWHPFWARKLLDVPNIQHLSDCRWKELRQGPFQTDSLMQFIDDNVAFMGTAIDRNFERWSILGNYIWPNSFVGQDYTEEISFLKDWLSDRLSWLDDNMKGNCAEFVSLSEDLPTSSLNIFPNPSRGVVLLDWNYSEPILLEIYDMNNRRVSLMHIPAFSNSEINLSDLKSGIYSALFRLKSNQKLVTAKKLVIID